MENRLNQFQVLTTGFSTILGLVAIPPDGLPELRGHHALAFLSFFLVR
jgi:hypothetical protein